MKIVLITGTSSGIGLATALRLARAGDRVYASMRDLHRAETLRQTATAEQLPVELVELDVDRENSVTGAVRQVLDQEGRLDVLVNNAGIAPFNPIEAASDDEVKRVFETNVFGALRMIRAVLPVMRSQRRGTIVNVSSVAGRLGPSCMGVYSASKFALEAASESLAREVFPHGIRVVIIEPGIIVTPILEKALANLPSEVDSPYSAAIRRTRKIFAQGQENGGHPDLVAEVIERAIAAPDPKLRYLAGADAAVLVGGRARMSDEEWITMERHATDDEYFTEFATRFPAGLQLP
ncbi:MAG: SDR family oxidoreductase [Verrucomicrobiales bacterium]|nr:SDR family oxidoreductase [Verrucomicrobiales bacterium]